MSYGPLIISGSQTPNTPLNHFIVDECQEPLEEVPLQQSFPPKGPINDIVWEAFLRRIIVGPSDDIL
jgi:hypothetical protein